ncbi:MAG: hypothetical protein HYY13_09970 [Nitrospirae bacterium]|nr:hypothetical protein [Nitrospirota bacterium]
MGLETEKRSVGVNACLRVFLCSTALLLGACGDSKDDSRIRHVVFIVKENRTFDTYFGGYVSPSGESVEGTLVGQTSGGEVPLFRGNDHGPYVKHEHENALVAWNGGAMNGFDRLPVQYGPESGYAPYDSYVQYGRDDIPNYWALADRFVLADHYFTSAMASTLPNRIGTVAAQTAGVIEPPVWFQWHCGAKGMEAEVYGPDCTVGRAPVCFDIPVLPDLLEGNGLTWRMYVTPRDGGGFFNPLFAVRKVWDRVQSDPAYADEHFPPVSQLALDAAADSLPNVSWVIYPMEQSEHAPEGTVCCGEQVTSEDVWALMESPAWRRTLIVLTWNDWGGYYDHVPPPQPQMCAGGEGFYEPGFRVPALVVSPFVRRSSVTHREYEHASVLRAVEELFGISSRLHDRDFRARDSTVNSILSEVSYDAPDFSIPTRTPRACPSTCP